MTARVQKMNRALRAIMTTMLGRKCIGGKHAPEEKLLKAKTKWLQREELKEFKEEYWQMLNSRMILRAKKKTGKGSGWHISLNPRKLREIYEMTGEKNG